MSDQPWRGVAAENAEMVTGKLSALLRRRARRLLTALLRPYRRQVAWALVLIIVANVAALTGPWLVGVAIDRGIPPLMHDRDVVPLAAIMVAFFVAVGVQAVTTRAFVRVIGRFGEGVVRELRRRLFAHFQRLPVAFHERYTSGRVISRQTWTSTRSPTCSRRASTHWCPRCSRCCSWGWACCCSTGRWPWWCCSGSAR